MKNRKLRVETLEERALLAVIAGGVEEVAISPAATGGTTWVVNTVEDPTEWDLFDDTYSLREAISRAQTGDIIVFDKSLTDGKITLNGTEINITKGITIDATSIEGITIDANHDSRIFRVTGGDTDNPAQLIGLTMTGGRNVADSYGGGCIYNTGCSLIIRKSKIIENYSPNRGGGILSSNSDLAIFDSTVSDNIGYNGGGGIYNLNGSLTISDSIIKSNVVSGTYGYGGGIYNDRNSSYTTLVIEKSVISENSANRSGGGIYNYGLLTVTNSSITGNYAGDKGGGIYGYYFSISLINSELSGNCAGSYGGGIYNSDGSPLTIKNSTISGNSVSNYDGYGGGIYSDSSRTMNISNTIISYNYSTSDNDINTNSYSGSNNIIGQNPNFVVSPKFTERRLSNPDELNLSLTSISSAIDAGTNDVVETETDIAGNPRIVNEIVDIGAYEYQFEEPLDTPSILTGNLGVYVSAGANRHQITWDAIGNAVDYELAYSSNNRNGWTSIITSETSAVITGLTYGDEVSYRVRALGEGSFADSEWSEGKTFVVCPIDINGDGDIGGGDRGVLANCWLTEEGDDDYIPAADIDGNGDVGGSDRAYLANNWLNEVGTDDMIYPRPLAAEIVFAEFASADLAVDLDVF